MVKSVISISHPFPDGQRVTAVAVEYDREIPAQEYECSAFDVQDRNVTRVYTSDSAGERKEPCPGRFVMIELNPKDETASTLIDHEGKHLGVQRKHVPSRDQQGRGHGGPRESILPDGRKFKGPSGIYCTRDPIALKVKQKADISFADGSSMPAWENAVLTDKEINEWADLFEVRRFKDYDYNLFIPDDYDPDTKYPLLLFIHDAGTTGQSPRITLEQGIGATVFASPYEQKKHPCIIVAPQHSKFYPIANDNYWCFEDEHTLKELLDHVQEEYSVDENRIYTTGQSMGFMTSIQLLLDYPDYFAAALLPAGHWDIEKTATLWERNIWFFLSEDDRGAKRMIDGLPHAIEAIGGKAGIYEWNADQPTKELGKLIENVKNDGNTCHITVFPAGTINRSAQPDRTDGGGHNGTWHLVYQIEAARDWLFEQKRGN